MRSRPTCTFIAAGSRCAAWKRSARFRSCGTGGSSRARLGARLILPELLRADDPSTELVLDLKGRDRRLAEARSRGACVCASPQAAGVTICARSWPSARAVPPASSHVRGRPLRGEREAARTPAPTPRREAESRESRSTARSSTPGRVTRAPRARRRDPHVAGEHGRAGGESSLVGRRRPHQRPAGSPSPSAHSGRCRSQRCRRPARRLGGVRPRWSRTSSRSRSSSTWRTSDSARWRGATCSAAPTRIAACPCSGSPGPTWPAWR